MRWQWFRTTTSVALSTSMAVRAGSRSRQPLPSRRAEDCEGSWQSKGTHAEHVHLRHRSGLHHAAASYIALIGGLLFSIVLVYALDCCELPVVARSRSSSSRRYLPHLAASFSSSSSRTQRYLYQRSWERLCVWVSPRQTRSSWSPSQKSVLTEHNNADPCGD